MAAYLWLLVLYCPYTAIFRQMKADIYLFIIISYNIFITDIEYFTIQVR